MTASLEDVKPVDFEEWLTLNTAASPTKLKLGQSPSMNNVWTDEKPGSVITANGLRLVGNLPSGNPASFGIDFFRSNSGTHLAVLSDNQTVYTTLDFQTFTPIITGLSSSFQLRGMIIRDKLWLTNGSDSVRTYDGTTVTVLDGTAGTPNVPKGRYMGYHDERVWMYHLPSDRSALRFTTLLDNAGAIIAPDSANAWGSSNSLQVSEGDADFGCGLILYRGYLYAFKQYSIYRIIGYDEYTYQRVKTRASTGTRFNESLQIKDNLIHLIGVDGFYVFDGEDAERISDEIDPAAASQTAFGFNDLQQPNTNNQFWQTVETVDWEAGTKATNVAIDNQLALVAADDSAANFAAGATLTNVTATDNSGSLQLSHSSSGRSLENVASGKTSTVTPDAGSSLIGAASFVTDGALTNAIGFSSGGRTPGGRISIAVNVAYNMTTIVLKSFRCNGAGSTISFKKDGVTTLPALSVTGGGSIVGGNLVIGSVPITPIDLTLTFAAFTATSVEVIPLNNNFGGVIIGGTVFFASVTEIQIYSSGYNATGQFISKTLDLGAIPNSLGFFNATETVPAGTTALYFTQSSADGSAWDAAVACTNGGAVGSTVRRYLRWRVDFTSDGTDTPVIAAVYLATQFISPVHNTAGSIFAWGVFESDYALAGQTINFYYRSGTTSLLAQAAAWKLIVPGGVVSDAVANQFIQFKIEILGGTATALPVVSSVTINWVVGTGTQPNTLQNVASATWRNRYWLAAAGAGATANDTILIRGKKTFNNPWQLKDWQILTFFKFYDSLYGCSSTNGAIYKLDTGYSIDGGAMDSFFETGDITRSGFQLKLSEILIETERLGPYNLTVGISKDQGATWTDKNVDLTVSSYCPNLTYRINYSDTSERFRFRVRINAADQPFEVHRMVVFFSITQARGSIR